MILEITKIIRIYNALYVILIQYINYILMYKNNV